MTFDSDGAVQRYEAVTSGGSDRAFGFVFSAVFVILAVLLYRKGMVPYALGTFLVSLAFLIITLTVPRVLAPANRLWTYFGLLLHKVINPVVMGGIFFIVLTPVAVVMRIAGRDVVFRKPDQEAKSYWIEREPGPTPESMKRQF